MPPVVREDLTVEGDILVRGEVKVMPGAVLTVRPGTRFLFEPFDPDRDGVNDSRMVVEGVLTARGEPDEPILFTSAAADPGPGDWLELRMDRSEGSVLEYCILEHSRYGLHVHFSSGLVANSVFRDNIDGTRFGTSTFDFAHNLVRGNEGKGINLRDSRIAIRDNRITDNGHGVFLFERAGGSVIAFNSFEGNRASDIRLGDFYEGRQPPMTGNRRRDGSAVEVAGAEAGNGPGPAVEDPSRSRREPGPAVPALKEEMLWKTRIGSFLDATPVLLDPEGRMLALASWENGLVVLESDTGAEKARAPIPDITDASPVTVDGILYVPSWDRKVRAVDPLSGSIVGEAGWEASPADDHRQASPVADDSGRIFLGLWNGDFRALDPAAMGWSWSVTLDGPVRGAAAPAGALLWVGTDKGSLYRLGKEGKILDSLDLGSAVRAAPAVLDEDGLAVVTREGVLHFLQDGEVAWRRRLPGPGTYASPVVVPDHDGRIIVGDGAGIVSSYTRNGALMWRLDLGSAVHCIAGPAQGYLLAGTESSGVGVFTLTGRLLGSLESRGAVHGVALRDRGKDVLAVYGSRDGLARAYSLTLSESPWEPPAP